MAYGDYYYGFKPYVSVGSRRAQAARAMAKLQKKGRTMSPVVIDGRKIAQTFWGEAWCDNLERYSDFANRLPRGRSYARNGSVIDLQVGSGRVTAVVSGSSLYDVSVTVESVPRARWTAICQDCSGAIDSLVELLQGRFSKSVMARLCQDKTGLFPSPKEILFTCSCPDWASMCKHVAAVLYGIGARLDDRPELLFALRQVDQQDLIARAGSGLSKAKAPAGAKRLAEDDLSEMFGIEMAPPASPAPVAAKGVAQTPSKTRTPEAAVPRARVEKSKLAKSKVEKPKAAKPRVAKPRIMTRKVARSKVTKPKVAEPKSAAAAANTNQSASTRPGGRERRLTPAMRQAVAERMRQYWAGRRLG
jgi:uncharacterized Zn finger protein